MNEDSTAALNQALNQASYNLYEIARSVSRSAAYAIEESKKSSEDGFPNFAYAFGYMQSCVDTAVAKLRVIAADLDDHVAKLKRKEA